MDVVSLNDAAITLCGILGVGLFYWIGKKGPVKPPRKEEDSDSQKD
ncbi:MAG: hypothetical protein Q4F72_03750 [Desulfovibrionaceae bacterium]|nr:hypothetical protein [Desulfovibrionaceae bacterium]